MTEYIKKDKVVDMLYKFHIDKADEDCINAIEDMVSENVVEREKINKVIEEIKGQFFVLLKGETHIEEYWWNKALEKTLKIFKRNIGE